MFKRHVYTCPDVIYIMNRNRRINHISIGVSLVLIGGLYMYGKTQERKLDEQIASFNENVPQS